MRKGRSVRRVIFGSYTVIIVLSFFLLAAVLSVLQLSDIRSRTLNRLEQESRAAALGVTREIDQMRTMAMNISYSTRMQDRLVLPKAAGESEKLSAILSLIVLPNRPIDQINIYTLDGMRISSGLLNQVTPALPKGQAWYNELQDPERTQTLLFTGPDAELAKFSTDPYGREFLTLAMNNYDNFGTFCGYIEIRQRVSRFADVFSAFGTEYGEQLLFYDREGQLIWPREAAGSSLFEEAGRKGFPEEWAGYSGGMMRCESLPGGFSLMTCVRAENLLHPARRQILVIVGTTLAILVLAIAFSNLASRRITTPIAEICDQITGIDIERPAPLPEVKTDVLELQMLHRAFDRMQGTLSGHVAKLLELQNQEMQSRILALQAQMNPHFLYNSLQALQAMSEEGMNAEISEMCQAMAGILRYISSDSAQKVPLEDEIVHTREYLRCMEIRYQGDLTWEISVPEEMKGVLVPKLCVQLLVENAIKFTTTLRPPYHVEIRGVLRGDAYELSIRDNGPGFREETLTALEEQMREIQRTGTLPSLKINGMGILHVYIRFRLLYDNFLFRLENNPEGGACVTIGAGTNEQSV